MTSPNEKGLQKGIRQGLRQGIQQGSLRAKQEDVLDILEARFVTVPESITGKIETIDDLTVLRTLHRTAVTATSLEEFQGNLP